MSRRTVPVFLLALALALPALAGPERCSSKEQQVSRALDKAYGVPVSKHLSKYFSGGGSYLVTDSVYNKYVKGSPSLGRPYGKESLLWVLGSGAMDGVVSKAMKNGKLDTTVLEKSLGFDRGTFASGGLWRVDVDVDRACSRYPKADDPGANSHFEPGGFTSGRMPELVVIGGKARKATNLVRK